MCGCQHGCILQGGELGCGRTVRRDACVAGRNSHAEAACRRGDPRYSEPALAAALEPLAHQVDRMSMRRLLTAPAKPQERSKCDSSRFASAHPCALFRARWTGALEAMALEDEQAEALLAARSQTLERLRVLYEERHELNNMTMAIMLPRPAPESFFDGTTARKLELMGQFGGKCALSHGQQLAEALDKIRDNLRQEQRIMVQLHSVLVVKVHTPPPPGSRSISSHAHQRCACTSPCPS